MYQDFKLLDYLCKLKKLKTLGKISDDKTACLTEETQK